MVVREPQPPLSGLARSLSDLRPELLRFLAARLGGAGEAEDAFHDLWIRVADGAGGPVANGRAYLYRCAQNLCLDRARARRRRAEREGRWLEGQQPPADRGEPVAPQPDAEAALIAREEAARLAAAIAALPAAAGRAFRLHKLDGLSHAEVARALGISVSGVEKHMSVAMAHLRRTLVDCGADDRRRLAVAGEEERRADPRVAVET